MSNIIIVCKPLVDVWRKNMHRERNEAYGGKRKRRRTNEKEVNCCAWRERDLYACVIVYLRACVLTEATLTTKNSTSGPLFMSTSTGQFVAELNNPQSVEPLVATSL